MSLKVDGEIIFLGTGSAFNTKDYQSNALIHVNGKFLCIDCGSCFPFRLYKSIIKQVSDIDAYYISHPHADHVGGLEYVALSTYFDPTVGRPKLYGNRHMLVDLWDSSLKGGLDTIQDHRATLNSFWDVTFVDNNEPFVWEGIEFQPIQTTHVQGGYSLMLSYGLIFELGGKKIFFTADTQFCPNQIQDFYDSADVIFQDCETTPFHSRVHAHYDELYTLNAQTKKKMFLYHYADGDKPNCKRDGFAGWAKKGKVYGFRQP